MDKSFESHPDSVGNASDIANITRQFQEYRIKAGAELARRQKELEKAMEELRWQQSDSLDKFRDIRDERDKFAEQSSIDKAEIVLLGQKVKVNEEEGRKRDEEFEVYRQELTTYQLRQLIIMAKIQKQ